MVKLPATIILGCIQYHSNLSSFVLGSCQPDPRDAIGPVKQLGLFVISLTRYWMHKNMSSRDTIALVKETSSLIQFWHLESRMHVSQDHLARMLASSACSGVVGSP